jgi:hypothetical protein
VPRRERWPDDDLATSQLPKRFYEGMLRSERIADANALHAARLDHRRDRSPMGRDPTLRGVPTPGEWRQEHAGCISCACRHGASQP